MPLFKFFRKRYRSKQHRQEETPDYAVFGSPESLFQKRNAAFCTTVFIQIVLCHATGAVDKTILRLIIFFIRIRKLRMVTEPVADTKVFIGGSRNIARFPNDFFVTVCGTDNRFVHVSTDEVYGSLNDTDEAFLETLPLAPNSPYSASKASSDLIVRAYTETFNMNTSITRCSNNYGPNQHEEKLIPLMIKKAKNNEKLPVYGTGTNIRDWLYVEDHCRAIDMVLHNGKKGEIYNIGGNNEKTNLYIVKTILKQLGKSEDLISFVEDRKGHDYRYAINSSKIQKELGWSPSVTFEEGIRKTIEWYGKSKKLQISNY